MSEVFRNLPRGTREKMAADEIAVINANKELRGARSVVPKIARGTSPGTRIEDLDENSWADITEVDMLPEETGKETTTDVGDALREIGVRGNLPASSETLQAMREIKELGATFNDPEVVADRNAIKAKEKNAELEAMSDSVLRTAERNIFKAEADRVQGLKNAIANMPPSREFTDKEKLSIKNKGRDIFIDKLKLAYVNALEHFDPKLTKGKDNEEVAMILPPTFTLKPWKIRELSRLKDLHTELINAIEESNKSK